MARFSLFARSRGTGDQAGPGMREVDSALASFVTGARASLEPLANPATPPWAGYGPKRAPSTRSLAEQQDTTQNRLLRRVLIPAIEAQTLQWWPAPARAWGGANQVAPLYSPYYEWRLQQGSFGEWVLIRVWGRNGTVLGQILRAWCPNLDSGAIRHAEAIQRRDRRGYSRGADGLEHGQGNVVEVSARAGLLRLDTWRAQISVSGWRRNPKFNSLLGVATKYHYSFRLNKESERVV